MGGSGAEIQGLLWKNSGEVLLPKLRLKEQGRSKSNQGKETVLWLKLHWEGRTHPLEFSHSGDGMFRNPKESSLLFGNIESNHTRAVLTRPEQGGREHWRDSRAAPTNYSPSALLWPSAPSSPASTCLWLSRLGLLCHGVRCRAAALLSRQTPLTLWTTEKSCVTGQPEASWVWEASRKLLFRN